MIIELTDRVSEYKAMHKVITEKIEFHKVLALINNSTSNHKVQDGLNITDEKDVVISGDSNDSTILVSFTLLENEKLSYFINLNDADGEEHIWRETTDFEEVLDALDYWKFDYKDELAF